jgi:serine/threonine protein kinase
MTPLCPSAEDLLRFAQGQSRSDEVQRHVNDCPRCREQLNQLRTEGDASSDRLVRTLVWAPALPTDSAAYGSQEFSTTADLPATIGKYRIVRALDKGGQAFVFLAIHPTLHKEVVIKWSRWPMDGAGDERTGLLSEGRLLAELDAPGLARIYDLDFDDDRPFLVMEYIRGRNLKQYAEQERPTPRQAAALLAPVARSLQTAHARGIIHLDIKPHNIVIDENGRPYLIDFGLAKLCHAWVDEIGSAGLMGTPAFMSPEQARGDNHRIGSRTDLFALGGVLYYLLTGKPPFSADTASEAVAQAARCDWDREALRKARVPRPLARLCAQALSANPDDRPRSAQQMAERLEAFADRPRRFTRIAALVLLLLMGMFAWWWRPWTSSAAAGGEPALEVQVWRGQQSLHLLDALPLRSGDEVQVIGQVPSGLEPALFWFDSEGRLQELPLETSSSGGGTPFRYPPRRHAVQLVGPPGTEVLLVCARRSGRVDAEEIRKLFAERPWSQLPPHALLRLDRRQVRLLGTRGPGQLTDRPNSGIVEQAETLRRELAEHLDLAVAVAFPHR